MIFNFNGLSWVDNDHNIAFTVNREYFVVKNIFGQPGLCEN